METPKMMNHDNSGKNRPNWVDTVLDKKLFVKDLPIKEDFQSVFLIKNMRLNQGKDGRDYMALTLSDQSGEVDSRVWQHAKEAFEILEKTTYVAIMGKLNLFQGRKQLIVSEYFPINSTEVDERLMLKASDADPIVMFESLKKIVSQLEDEYIKQLLLDILSDQSIHGKLLTWPAGKSVHHNYQSGLLEHILSCAQLAKELSPKYKVNSSYVVAGAILHDLCKIDELSEFPSVDYTDRGKLVGHLVDGVLMVERFARNIEGFPEDCLNHLYHILLSHHGEYAYGSPKIPQTKEAMLVHLIDLMDSKMSSFDVIIEEDSNDTAWSAYNRFLDRIVYKKKLPSYKMKASHENSPKDIYGKSTSKHQHKKMSPTKEIKQNLGSLMKNIKID